MGITSISRWSYSIYLVHIPCIWLSYYLLDEVRGETVGNIASKLLALILTIAVSNYTYHYYEVPMTSRRPKAIDL